MEQNPLPKVGDVIQSEKFAFGYYASGNRSFVTVDGHTTEYTVSFPISITERFKIAAETGNSNPPEWRDEDCGAYDESRGTAEFLVEEARNEGGGTAHGPGDIFGDGWHVTVRRLNEDGSYNPEGEVIRFYMTGNFLCMVKPDEVKIVRTMARG